MGRTGFTSAGEIEGTLRAVLHVRPSMIVHIGAGAAAGTMLGGGRDAVGFNDNVVENEMLVGGVANISIVWDDNDGGDSASSYVQATCAANT